MQNLEKLKYLYENEPRKFPNVSKRELAARLQQIEQIQLYVNGDLSREYRALEGQNLNTEMVGDRQQDVRGADGEFDRTRDQDNRGIIQVQKDIIKEQDKDITQIINVVKATKHEGEEFKTEINKQNKQLENLNEDIVRVDDNMVDATNRMNRLLKKSNQWCLLAIIGGEIAILILIMLLL